MKVQYKGIEVFYSDEGHGDAILLLHGFLENSSMWNSLKYDLLKTHRVICVDLLGHGRTASLGNLHKMEEMAAAVESVVDHLGLEKVILFGHSMGGYVSLAFAELFPYYLKGLVLINSTPLPDSKEKRLARDRAIEAATRNKGLFISMTIPNLFADKNHHQLKKEIQLTKDAALQTSLQGIVAALAGMKVRKNRLGLLKKINCRKMIVIGRNDAAIDVSSLDKAVRDVAIEVVEFSDGHMSHIENKTELSYACVHFIENI
ncbi:MAG: alpha/beta hydrolase [Flavobacteriaceae bacterium]|nr:MAG: alpha/beta hydrolase [Flavobacteriaceae bacterium]